MHRRHGRHDKRDHKMESEKTGQGGVIHRKPPSEPQNQVRTEVGESGEEIGDHRCSPEPYLPSWKNIPQEGGRHHQNQQQDAGNPRLHVYITAIVKTSAHMPV